MTILYRETDAAVATADIEAKRAGSCAMMRARSAAPHSTQRAISSSERPQPMQSCRVGWTTQTRMQGVSIPVSALVMAEFGCESRHHNGRQHECKRLGEQRPLGAAGAVLDGGR
jgi:hypothetical protein